MGNSFLKTLSRRKSQILILILLSLISVGYLSYRWAYGHVLWSADYSKVTINGLLLRERGFEADYMLYKSLGGDIFCYHMDHGTQYFIDVRKKEVSVIKEGYKAYENDALTIYTPKALSDIEDSEVKQILPSPQLIIGRDYIEFNGFYNERWHIPV